MGNIDAKRIARNTILLYIRMIFIMIINIYMARVVLRVLGIEDYGIYNVVAGAVAFLGFLSSAMSLATQRFINVELGKKQGSNLRKVFSMAFNIHAIIGVIIIILAETVGLLLVNETLNIPPERMFAANIAFQSVVFSTFFSVIQVPYNSAVFAYEKMDVYAYLSIFDVCLKLALTYMLEWAQSDKLVIYSILMFGVHVLLFFIYSTYVSNNFRECRLSLIWDKEIFKSLSGFLGWNLCGQIAQILTTQGVNMIANVFYGVALNASIAITHHANAAIATFVNNFQTSFRPQIMKSYAAEQYDGMKQLVYKASKASFFLLYIISVPIMMNIDYILNVWLEEVPEYSSIFCKLLIWYSYFEALGMPLVMAIMATGRNKYYQIVVSLAISLNLLLTWLFLHFGCSPEWIFYVKIVLSFLVIYVRILFADKQAGVKPKEFIKHSLWPSIKVVVLTQPMCFLVNGYIETAEVITKFIITMPYIFYIIACVYFIGFTSAERYFVKKIIIDKIHKK